MTLARPESLVLTHPHLDVLRETASAVRSALDALDNRDDWALAGTRPGQHRSDLVADAAALEVLAPTGWGVVSEESGEAVGDGVTVVVDPLDGSTNAMHGIPWFAVSLCVVDDDGPQVALVSNLAGGSTYEAVRGQGAWCGATPMAPSDCHVADQALVCLSGYPPSSLGWRQYRALGAAALDLCMVAAGQVDAYVDCSVDAHGVWDYLAAALICREAGAVVVDAHGRDLTVLEHAARRTPVAAATGDLLAELRSERNRVVVQ
jgi:myo-inositol-1(or 4)-monophosphatase